MARFSQDRTAIELRDGRRLLANDIVLVNDLLEIAPLLLPAPVFTGFPRGGGGGGPAGGGGGGSRGPQGLPGPQGPAGPSILFIGEPVTGGTPGAVLFVGAAGDLQEQPAEFFWDSTNLVLQPTRVNVENGTAVNPAYGFTNFPGTGFYMVPGPFIVGAINTGAYFSWSPGQYVLSSGSAMLWSATLDPTGGVYDISLSRSGASTLSIAAASVLYPTGNVVITGGGLVLGAPVGGDKGVGTINVSGDIYKNNLAYNNPDYVFESWAKGRIERFKDNPGAKEYAGVQTLEEVEEYCREHLRLPGISDEPAGMFARSDLMLEKIEEIFIHLFDLRKKLLAAQEA